jgi:hypothetical protein
MKHNLFEIYVEVLVRRGGCSFILILLLGAQIFLITPILN